MKGAAAGRGGHSRWRGSECIPISDGEREREHLVSHVGGVFPISEVLLGLGVTAGDGPDTGICLPNSGRF